jgi:hypothetical protein
MSTSHLLRRGLPALALLIASLALLSTSSARAQPYCPPDSTAPICNREDPPPPNGGGTNPGGTGTGTGTGTAPSCSSAPGAVAAFRSDTVGAGQSMTTSATATCSSATIVATTRTRTTNAFWGFHGCVAFDLIDASGRVMRRTPAMCFGVDGTLIGRSDRTDTFTQSMTPAEAASLRMIGIVHS